MGTLKERKRQHKRAQLLGTSEDLASVGLDVSDFIPGPKLRAKFGISAVTLWRWRHDPDANFPTPKIINGRLYFALGEVTAWIQRQPEAT
jgi:predicted DNA-binding transcriptional regulator AlpA